MNDYSRGEDKGEENKMSALVQVEELNVRDSLVFISCQPDNYTQNDDDSDGMQHCNLG